MQSNVYSISRQPEDQGQATSSRGETAMFADRWRDADAAGGVGELSDKTRPCCAGLRAVRCGSLSLLGHCFESGEVHCSLTTPPPDAVQAGRD
jgi:hypothetical protein